MRRTVLASVVGVVVVAAAGCGGSETQATPEPQLGPPEPETKANLADEPCSAGEVEALVTAFVRAFNEVDTAHLDALFASAEDFEWYSTQSPGERLDDEAKNRSTLMTYFKQRHQTGERLRLRSFQFGGNSDGYGNFEYQLVRSADDIPATQYDGKGAAYCFDGRPDLIFVWSMGRA